MRYKIRPVIQGFKDINKHDTTEIYAPVPWISDFKFILSVANKFDLDVFQLDIKIAFLQSELEKPVFMKISEIYPYHYIRHGLCEDGEFTDKLIALKRE